ncbi:VWA domain-containing protein [Roseiconus lacunae]|uniref:VWA domain-containing protein n=1 Tax=Roseiconus lacunae TaxID=2605694 RepID=UPI001E443B4A|nr:VWA domain-containing protein [Roseiconus lacunae]MCD0462913.1 VWA domain-containing protein [Roseiconus lacunae]
MAFDVGTFFYLPLLLLIPLIWLGIRRIGLAIGPSRAWLATGIRSALMVLVVLALSDLQFGWLSDQVSVVYVVDQSASVSHQTQAAMVDYATRSAARDRNDHRRDLAGLVTFAADARIEMPPDELGLPRSSAAASLPRNVNATNLEQAIDLATAAMPPNSRRRLVLMTDGRTTDGNASKAATRASQHGIGIDVVPIAETASNDVALERLDLPATVDAGQDFSGRLVARYTTADVNHPIQGNLSITQSAFGQKRIILSESIQLAPGKNVLPFDHRIDSPAMATFTAEFIPNDRREDRHRKNNEVSSFMQVGGASRTLLIENPQRAGEFAMLTDWLRQNQIDLDVRSSDTAFDSIAELMAYDSVILANVPRAGGGRADQIGGLSERQAELLVQYSQQFGAGLLMIGGPDSFGAGGWRGSAIERAMPVDFDIKNSKVRAVGALLLVLDSSGSMGGQKLQLCKAAARSAIETLGTNDYVGIVTFDGDAEEVIPLQQVKDRRRMYPAISRIQADGGTNLYPAMQIGYAKLSRIQAMVKHMIIVSDGNTQPGAFQTLSERMNADGITVSTLAIGGDADRNLLNQIATVGQGKFYAVQSPRAIPRIVMHESRRIAKPLIYEVAEGMAPLKSFPHPIVHSIGRLPPINGLVLTTPKQSALVQNLLMSPRPEYQDHPILSVWTYGVGRVAALTTDAGQRWATGWEASADAKNLWLQLIRWLKRPASGHQQFQVTTRWNDGEIEVVVDVLDFADLPLELLRFQAAVVGSDLKPISMQLRQVAPGRFRGTVPMTTPGSYFVNVITEEAQPPIVRGVNVPFGAEYATTGTELSLLDEIVRKRPAGGSPGILASPIRLSAQPQVEINHYRGGLAEQSALRDVWPWLILASCFLFLGDIGTRRLDLRRHFVATRHRPQIEAAVDKQSCADVVARPQIFRAVNQDQDDQAPESYVDRLLAAKRRTRRRSEPDRKTNA